MGGQRDRRDACEREAVRHHGRLQPERLECRSQELPERHGRLRGVRHPVPVRAGGRLGPGEPGAGQLRLHPRDRRRDGVHVQPQDQRPAGDEPATVRREHLEDLHRCDQDLERPGDRRRQPRADDAGAGDRAGRPFRRLRLDGAVHEVDDRPAPADLGDVLPERRPSASAGSRRSIRRRPAGSRRAATSVSPAT